MHDLGIALVIFKSETNTFNSVPISGIFSNILKKNQTETPSEKVK